LQQEQDYLLFLFITCGSWSECSDYRYLFYLGATEFWECHI